MSKLTELNNNLSILGLSKIKEIFPFTLEKKLIDNNILINILYELTENELKFRDERAKQINITVSNFLIKKDIKFKSRGTEFWEVSKWLNAASAVRA